MLSELPVKRGGSSVIAPSLSDEQIDVLARRWVNHSLPVPEELANRSLKAVYENVLAAIRKSKSVR
jgi:hypothetical protein